MSHSSKSKSFPAGRLLLIGGNEDPDEDNLCILPYFVKRSGGKKANLLVCAGASAEPKDTLRAYKNVFEKIGVTTVTLMPLTERGEAEDEEWLSALEAASGVFFTGGDQLRLSSLLAGTPFERRLQERYEKGLYVAGTSAGAAVMSGTMIIRGAGGTVRRSEVELAPGLGYWRDSVVDTHFNRSGRAHRLLSVIALNPGVLGVGLDENTAVEVTPGSYLTVVGRGVVILYDGRVTHVNTSEVEQNQPIALTDVTVHVLPADYCFDFTSMRPFLPNGDRILSHEEHIHPET